MVQSLRLKPLSLLKEKEIKLRLGFDTVKFKFFDAKKEKKTWNPPSPSGNSLNSADVGLKANLQHIYSGSAARCSLLATGKADMTLLQKPYLYKEKIKGFRSAFSISSILNIRLEHNFFTSSGREVLHITLCISQIANCCSERNV